MSLDNVVAVAAIAREDTALLVFWFGFGYSFDGFFCYVYNARNDKISMALMGWTDISRLPNYKDAC